MQAGTWADMRMPAGEQACKQLGGLACRHAGVPSIAAVFTAPRPLIHQLEMPPLGGGPMCMCLCVCLHVARCVCKRLGFLVDLY